jgi:hypothetical protein
MGPITELSHLESLMRSVSLQIKDGSENIVKDKLSREALLTSLRQLTLELETPDDIVNRVVFFV